MAATNAIRHGMGRAAAWGMALPLLVGPAAATGGEDVVTEEMRFERQLMAALAQVQQRPGAHIQAFQTDGCSGGLSAGWEFAAERIPQFRRRYGQAPPWEHCCIEHDRAYWRGETADGYRKRKAADAALRGCVIATGRRLAPDLVKAWSASPEEVSMAFGIAAELMYAAVRVGGLPCSPFPWRWGYGWPACAPLEETVPD